jgi:chromosome segregation ATPase
MSKEEVNLIKDEIYQKIREFEAKINKELNGHKAEMNSTYNKFNERISSILNNNREMIESVASEKINIEKFHALENFKNKADGMLISHEIRINNHNKDINNMKTKYDKAMIDNLTVPGFIGTSCQYKNIGEYILENRNEFSRFKYDKENLKQEIKDIKIKLDNIFKKTLSLVDNSIERCKEYTNGKILEYNKHFDTKFDEFEERSMEIRLELQQSKSDIEEKVNNLRLETGKLLLMKEKFVTIDENINDINNKIDKINCDTNKLNEKNDDNEKLLEKLKKDVVKMKKFLDESKSKHKDKEKNKKKEKKYESTKDVKDYNSVSHKKSDVENKRLSIFSQEDRSK